MGYELGAGTRAYCCLVFDGGRVLGTQPVVLGLPVGGHRVVAGEVLGPGLAHELAHLHTKK
jgi:hypothetical protein